MGCTYFFLFFYFSLVCMFDIKLAKEMKWLQISRENNNVKFYQYYLFGMSREMNLRLIKGSRRKTICYLRLEKGCC